MDYLIQFQANIFAFIMLIVLLMIVKLKMSISSFGKQILMATIIFNMATLILEPLTWLFDGAHFFGAYILEYGTNFLIIILAPLIASAMLCYVDFFLFKDVKRIKRRLFYLHPVILTFLLLIVNIFYPIYFDVNSTNDYFTADYLWIQSVIISLMYLFMILFLIKNRKKTSKFNIGIFVAFFALPIIGMFVQNLDIRLQLDWGMIAIGILVVYVFLESTISEQDYLTKLYNRQSYEKHVQHLINIDKDFNVMLIDLDKFKEINDQYGHKKGDSILIDFAKALQKALKPNKYVFRLGGDEFTIVFNADNDIDEIIHKIEFSLKQSDEKLLKKMKFSKGYCKFEKGMSLEDIYMKIDKLMYKEKDDNHN